MSETTTFSIRIEKETRERLEKLAKATARSRQFLISEAIKEYIDINEWQIQEIQQAIEEADKPGAEFIYHEEVRKKWEGKLANPMDTKRR